MSIYVFVFGSWEMTNTCDEVNQGDKYQEVKTE